MSCFEKILCFLALLILSGGSTFASSEANSLSPWYVLVDTPDGYEIDVDGIDANGDSVVATGYFQNKIKIMKPNSNELAKKRTSASPDNKQLYLFKTDLLGNTLWAKQFGNAGTELNAYDIVIDEKGNSYLSGSARGDWDFSDTVTIETTCEELAKPGKNVAYGQLFLAKYNSKGKPIWIHNSNSPTLVAGGNEIDIDNRGDIAQTVGYGRPKRLGAKCAKRLTSKNRYLEINGLKVPYDGGEDSSDNYISVVDKDNGDFVVEPIHIGGTGHSQIRALDTFAEGDLPEQRYLFTGFAFRDEIKIYNREGQSVYKTTTYTSEKYDQDNLVAKFDYTGKLLWTQHFGSPGRKTSVVTEQVKGVVATENGDVVLSAVVTGDIILGEKKYKLADHTPDTLSMGIVARLDGRTGQPLWVHTFSTESGVLHCCEISGFKKEYYATPVLVGKQFSSILYESSSTKYKGTELVGDADTKKGLTLIFSEEGELNIAYQDPVDEKSSYTTGELAVTEAGLFGTGEFNGVLSTVDGELASPGVEDVEAINFVDHGTLKTKALDFSGSVILDAPMAIGFPHKMDLLLPRSINADTGLVVALHGGGGEKENFAYNLGLKQSSNLNPWDYNFSYLNEKNIAVLLIQGESLDGSKAFGWNNHVMKTGQNDKELLIQLSKQMKGDFKKIYLMGHSMGGVMVNRMWCEASTHFDAFGSSAGPMSKQNYVGNCDPQEKKPYIHATGLNDRILQIVEEKIDGSLVDHSEDEFLTLDWRTYLGAGPTVIPENRDQFANELVSYELRVHFVCGEKNVKPVEAIFVAGGSHKVKENCGGRLKMLEFWGLDHCLRGDLESTLPTYKCDRPLNSAGQVKYLNHFVDFFKKNFQ